jgi:FkbM family methyltransferase
MFGRVTPDGVIDVGANRGQFALACCCYLPGVPLHSFEPLGSEAAAYRKVVPDEPGSALHSFALGEEPGVAKIHVSARRDSSSLLPIGQLQTAIFPETAEVGTQEIQVRRLDDLPEAWEYGRALLLKLDVQGFELSVLKGATQALTHCQYVYCECSEVELYQGQALSGEIRAFLASHGFRPVLTLNESRAEGRLIQADYLFERE